MSRFKLLRKQKKLTQQEVADALKITRVHYTNIENGKRETNFETLSKLAALFEVSTDYLLGISDNPVNENMKNIEEEKEVENFISIMGSNGSQMKIPVPPDKADRLKSLIKAGLPELLEDERFKDL